MNKACKLVIIVCLIFSLTFQLGVSAFAEEKVSSVQDKEITQILKEAGAVTNAELKEVAQNENLVMYINTDTAEVYVKDKKVNKLWSTNPINKNKDSIAVDLNKDLLSSQLILKYSNDKGQINEKNSYTDSVKHSQFKIDIKDNKAKVSYKLGIEKKVFVIPKVISEKRFKEKIESKVKDEKKLKEIQRRYQLLDLQKINTQSEKKKYLDLYPILKEKNIYILRQSSNFQLEDLQKSLKEIGYTSQDMEVDHKENKVPEEEGSKEVFEVSLVYQLDQNGITVDLPIKDLNFNKSFPVTEISILPFMGSVYKEDKGFIFVPDGSGGIINLTNKKNVQGTYLTKVYGEDGSIFKEEKFSQDLKTVMPVFGIQTEHQGIFGIIEEGETYASIGANLAGKVNSFHNIGAIFTVLMEDRLDVKNLAADKVVKVYQKRPYQKNYRVKYMLYTPEKGNYMDMAKIYQNYLEKAGVLSQRLKEQEPYFISEVIGAVDKVKTICGIPFNVKEPLTTFKQSKKITDEILKSGIKNVKLRYTGWLKGGIYHEDPRTLKIEKVLGSQKDFTNLKKYAESNTVHFYPEIEVQYLNKNNNKLFDKFIEGKHAARFINREVAYIYSYSIPTFRKDIKNPAYVANKSYTGEVLKNIQKNLKKKDMKYVSLGSLGRDVNSDFNEKNFTDRQETADIMKDELKVYKDNNLSVMVDGGNIYSLPYVDTIVNMPTRSNAHIIIDESVPFYQIVLHGYKNYAGEPVNLSQDVEKNKLKTVETGSAIYYKWFYSDLSVIKDTNVSNLFSGSYDKWKKDAVEFYNRVNKELGDTYNQKIVNHKKIENGIYEITYEKGKKVYVNYNNYLVNTHLGIIKPLDFLVIPGGEK